MNQNSMLKLTMVKGIFFIMILLLVIACSGKSKVRIKETKNGFNEILIENKTGKDILIAPVDSITGGVGYKINGQISWVSGKSEISELNGSVIYTWKNDINEITLEVINTENDIELVLNYSDDSDNKPESWYLNIQAEQEEYFTGLFERVVDGHQINSWANGIQVAMDVHGEKIEMKLKPTVSAYAPFYLSSLNYGFFVKGTWPGVFDICKSNETVIKITFEGPSMDFKIYTGTPAEIVKKHTMETGPVFVPPKWAFGPWRWRDDHSNNPAYYDGTEKKAPYNTDIVEDVLMMGAMDIPLTAVWIDRPWAIGKRGFDDYEFDKERLPQIEDMIQWLNNKNLKLMIWIAPFVMGEMAKYAIENNYSLKSKVWIDSSQVLMDFTNEEGVKWWSENGPGKLARMGIKGFKLDRADGEKLIDSLHLKTANGKTYRENYNDYPRQYVKATYDAVKDILGEDFILFPRAQYTGSSKYGGMWAGDTDGKQEGLRSALIALQRCAIMGYPVWGSDIGGYWGKFDHEVTQRWLGFGCFSPIMEVGPTNNKGFWNNPTEPQYDTNLIATWRLYSKIRMKLVDYLYNLVVEANKNGMPIARPLFLIYPDEKESWSDWQTYLLGSDLLVSVIWEKGINKHKLYLPGNEKWIDAWDTSQVYTGGQYIEVDAPAYKTPVFIRKDSGIDLGDLNGLWEESLKLASSKPDLKKMEKEEGWR